MKSNNQINIPEAREAMDQFKMKQPRTLLYPFHLKHYMKLKLLIKE